MSGKPPDQMAPLEGLSLGIVLFKCMQKWKENVAQLVPDKDYSETYGYLLKKCVRTAMKLQEVGVTENDVVGLCTLNDENTCVPFVASQFIGAKIATLHPNLSRENTTYLLNLVEPKVVFVCSDAESLIEECSRKAGINTRIVVFGRSDKHEEFGDYIKPKDDEVTFKPVPKDVMDTAIIAFTSGSTGYPKGACLSHYAILNRESNGGQSMLSSRSNSAVLTYSTLYWMSGIGFLIGSIASGTPRVLCSKFDPEGTWEIIEKYKVGVLFLTPSFAREAIDALQKDYDVSSLHCLIIGGDAVAQKLYEDITSALPNVTIMTFYGQTEFVTGCFAPHVIKRDDILSNSPKMMSCGKILPGVEWKVVDPETGKILGPTEEGELRVKSKFFIKRYYKIDSSSLFDEEGYIKTGDLFYYDEENYMYIIGRIKSVFKYRCWHVSPVVLEEILMSHPAVDNAIVVDIPHETDGNHPMGFVKLGKGYDGTILGNIKEFADDRLGDHEKLRGGLEIISDIPYTVTGKKAREGLRLNVLKRQI